MRDKIANGTQAFCAWAVLGVLALTILALGGNRPVVWTLMAGAVVLIFLGQLLTEALSARPRTIDTLWLPGLLFIGVLAWALAQRSALLPAGWAHPAWQAIPEARGTVSADPEAGRQAALRLASYGLVFWIALRACATREAALRYLRAIAVFATALSGFGIQAWVSGNNPILGDNAGALSASFVNRNNFATFAVFGVLANLALYTRNAGHAGGSGATRLRNALEGFFGGGWIWIAGLLICAGAVALSQSRAGGLALVIGVAGFLMVLRTPGRGTGLSGVAVVAIVAVLAVALTASGGLVDRILTADGEEGRFLVYPAVVAGIADRPWLGHGLGAFEDAFRAYVPAEAAFGEWDMAHNSYLENAFELGLPAAAAFYLALALVLVRIWQGLRQRQRGRATLAFAFGCALAGGFHAALDFSLQMPGLAALFAFILGMGHAQSVREAPSKGR